MITCIIVDDQKEAIDLLIDHVKKIPLVELKYSSTSPLEALDYLDQEKVDLIFLDVQMPDITGLEFIEILKGKLGHDMPKIILTTGFNDYAVKSYEYGVFDYLMKPVSFIRFKMSVDRIVNDLSKQQPIQTSRSFFFAETDGQKVKINFSDIIYIEGARNYIFIGTAEKRRIIYKSMNSMQEILPENQFLRVHKSFIIAIDAISAVRGNELMVKVNQETKNIPLGITYRENVLKRLNIGDR